MSPPTDDQTLERITSAYRRLIASWPLTLTAPTLRHAVQESERLTRRLAFLSPAEQAEAKRLAQTTLMDLDDAINQILRKRLGP